MNHGVKKKFVLAQGGSVPAAEVVRRAAAQGMSLSNVYVYVVRSNARGNGAQAPAARSKAQTTAGSAGTLQQAFSFSALEIGFARAEQLLSQLRSRTAQLR